MSLQCLIIRGSNFNVSDTSEKQKLHNEIKSTKIDFHFVILLNFCLLEWSNIKWISNWVPYLTFVLSKRLCLQKVSPKIRDKKEECARLYWVHCSTLSSWIKLLIQLQWLSFRRNNVPVSCPRSESSLQVNVVKKNK